VILLRFLTVLRSYIPPGVHSIDDNGLGFPLETLLFQLLNFQIIFCLAVGLGTNPDLATGGATANAGGQVYGIANDSVLSASAASKQKNEIKIAEKSRRLC
jgi:hypothetical protein